MGKKLYISDWHYGHANVLAFDNRPFKINGYSAYKEVGAL